MNLIEAIRMIIEDIKDQNYGDAIMMLNAIVHSLKELDTEMILVIKE